MNSHALPIVALASLLAACGGQSAQTPSTTTTAASSGSEQSTATAAGEHHGGEHHGGGHHGGGHHAMPQNLAPLHDVLAPVWHSTPGATRATAACAQAGRLDEASRGVASAASPEGVDPAAWGAAATRLAEASTALVTECRTPGPGAEARLETLHTIFHQLLDMQRH
jgi:hypothetical protein